MLGNVDAGKSTLLGVLTHGELDNGRGRARLNLFRHLHEIQSGRTSSISHEIIGFDTNGEVSRLSIIGFDTNGEVSRLSIIGFDTNGEVSRLSIIGFDTNGEVSRLSIVSSWFQCVFFLNMVTFKYPLFSFLRFFVFC